MHILRSLALAAVAASSAFAQISSAPCYESNLGTNLGLSDDSVAQNNPLGFTFPGPGGVQVTAIDISSNGFVWLGSSLDNGCCGGDLTAFLSGLPRIAPMWTDLYPPGGNGVFFNTFPATATTPARAVVTWDQLPEYGTQTPLFTVQLQLLENGEVVFYYDQAAANVFHNVMTGITQGNNAIANPIDFSAVTLNTPHNSGTNPTIHEEQNSTWDLAARSFEFIPNGSGGYLVFDRPACAPGYFTPFGRGCPTPATVYEFFDSTSVVDVSNLAFQFIPNGAGGWVVIPITGMFTATSNAITTGDDVITGPFALPFTFNFPGGSTNSIDVDSNGAIALIAGSLPFSRCCNGDVQSFLADPPTIAVLWEDLVPSSGTNLFVDNDPANQAVHITWTNVPEFAMGGSNTCQISLFASGQFRLSYGAVANLGHDALIGFSTGNGSIDPGNTDFSTAAPFTTGGGGNPLRLAPAAGSRPAIGQNFVLELNDIAANSTFGVLILGFGNTVPGFDLSLLGAPGCFRHVTIDGSAFFGLTGNPTPFTLAIPNNNAFLGYTLYSQAATLTPGANPLGVLTSNGGEIRIGR